MSLVLRVVNSKKIQILGPLRSARRKPGCLCTHLTPEKRREEVRSSRFRGRGALEIFPPQAKGVCSSLATAVNWLTSFAVTKTAVF